LRSLKVAFGCTVERKTFGSNDLECRRTADPVERVRVSSAPGRQPGPAVGWQREGSRRPSGLTQLVREVGVVPARARAEVSDTRRRARHQVKRTHWSTPPRMSPSGSFSSPLVAPPTFAVPAGPAAPSGRGAPNSPASAVSPSSHCACERARGSACEGERWARRGEMSVLGRGSRGRTARALQGSRGAGQREAQEQAGRESGRTGFLVGLPLVCGSGHLGRRASRARVGGVARVAARAGVGTALAVHVGARVAVRVAGRGPARVLR